MGVASIPAWCARYVGLPYATGGRGPAEVDCWGLFALVWAEQFKRPMPDYLGALWTAGSDPEAVAKSAKEYASLFKRIAPGDEREGDGILFRMRGHPLHLAMVVAPGLMLHVEDGLESCIEPYRTFQWERRIIDFYRYE